MNSKREKNRNYAENQILAATAKYLYSHTYADILWKTPLALYAGEC